MKPAFGPTKFIAVLAVVLLSTTLAYCAWFDGTEPDTAGTVIDLSTGKPAEGAYVLAAYRETGGTWFGHSGSWCVMTKGMYTGPDGKFRFPPVKSSPAHLSVIKPDYVWTVDGADIKRPLWDGKGKNPYTTDPNVYLKTQDPTRPDLNFGDEECERPRTQADVVANVEYLKLALAERIKYGAAIGQIETTRAILQSLQSSR
jgi:hypothetical protein